MIFHQFYLPGLGHASYFIGSEETGQGLVLDVRRDVDVYYRYARRKGMRIRYAADTHQHNDYLTGITELKQRSPVELLASARAQLGYQAAPVGEGDRLEMGEVVFQVLETPGHTPEHLSFLVYDRSRGAEPVILFSGGALLVGDVARPDLLGDAEETRRHARALCHTLKTKILTLPDHVMVFPTHVSGSLCGGSIGSMLFTTIGYERRMNKMLESLTDEDQFAKECLNLDDLPTVPPYWPRMRRQNIQGPQPLGVLTEPPALPVEAFMKQQRDGALVLDCRSPEAFGGGHMPGALNVGLTGAFATWAGTVLPADSKILLVLEAPSDLWKVTWELLRIGYDLPVGWLAGGMKQWRTAGQAVEFVPQWTVNDLKEQLQKDRHLVVLDVRQPAEWRSGHIRSALHIPGGALPERIGEVPRDRPLAVHCGSGYRSSVACSLLQTKGYKPVFNVLGGFSAWQARGFPVER